VGAEWQHESSETELAEFTLAVAERGPAASQRAVTIQTNTDVSRWFTFQASEEDQENRDQEMLEAFWAIIHRALPELGAGIEVLETANPRTFYDLTRRKLGMVRGTKQVPGRFGLDSMTYQTSLPNVFMVGDTVFPGAGLAAVSHSALIVANAITR
jgi:phytoene dehydrogenase-like protein